MSMVEYPEAQETQTVPCVVCKEGAEQKHHLSYDPELIIHVCRKCHQKIHKHGVGLGVRKASTNGKTKPKEPHFTTQVMIDGKSTIVEATTKEVLSWDVCICGRTEWQLFENKQKELFLRCPKCGRDYRVTLLWACT